MTNQFPFPQNPDGFPGGFPGGNQNFPGNMMPPFGQFPGQPGGPGQSFPPSFPPPGQQNPQGGAPSSPPPNFVPQRQSASVFAVDPGAIRSCLFRNTFVWLNNGRSFWLFPTFVGRNSVSGFRWNGFMWTFYGTDLRRIASFQCF